VAGVAAGQGVQVLQGALADQLGVAADLEVAVGVVGVDDQQADLGVGGQVAALVPFQGGVDPGAGAVPVDPDQAGLGLTVTPHGGQHPTDRPGQQIQMRGRDCNRLGRHAGGHPRPLPPVASSATTWVGRIRHKTGTSVSAKRAGMASPK
jgi:hypothetical protein